MGRAGSSSGGGGGHSSGGHSFGSRSSGGHRVGSSSSYSSGHSDWGYHSHHHHHGHYHHGIRISCDSILGRIITVAFFGIFIFSWIFLFFGPLSSTSDSIPVSTAYREKLESSISYENDCIVDELGWFDNIPATSNKLKYFYDKTGIQPFIVLKDYDASLSSDIDKNVYAEKWYEENIDNESTFLYMYFAEENTDEDVGYMVYVNGLEVWSIMDAEAVDIFWAYIDRFWYSDMSTDDLFVSVFSKTADRIMPRD